MTGPRRLDWHQAAPADLFDHLHPTTNGDPEMTDPTCSYCSSRATHTGGRISAGEVDADLYCAEHLRRAPVAPVRIV